MITNMKIMINYFILLASILLVVQIILIFNFLSDQENLKNKQPLEHQNLMSLLDKSRKKKVDVHNPSPNLSVDAIISNTYDSNEILMISRENFPHGWALPGGYVRIGETVENALIREIKQETNLTISDYSLFGVYSEPNRDPRAHVVTLVYNSKVLNMKCLYPGIEANKIDWFNIEKLLKMKEIIAFDHFKIISDYAKRRQNLV
jgi:8-oxo-dGTP diphosphatase